LGATGRHGGVQALRRRTSSQRLGLPPAPSPGGTPWPPLPESPRARPPPRVRTPGRPCGVSISPAPRESSRVPAPPPLRFRSPLAPSRCLSCPSLSAPHLDLVAPVSPPAVSVASPAGSLFGAHPSSTLACRLLRAIPSQRRPCGPGRGGGKGGRGGREAGQESHRRRRRGVCRAASRVVAVNISTLPTEESKCADTECTT